MHTPLNGYGKAVEWGILVAVFLTPLILLFYWITPGALGIKTVFFNAVMLVVFALWIMECATLNRLVFARSPLDVPIALFLLWNLASVLWSRYDYATMSQVGEYATYAFLYCMIVAHVREPRQISRLLVTIFLSVAVTCAYGVAQFLGYDFFRWYPQDTRILASLGNATFYAAHLILLLPLALNLYLQGQSRVQQALLWGLVGVMGFCLLATYTRAAWLALMVMGVVDLALLARYTGWLRPPRRASLVRIAALGLILAVALTLMGLYGPYSMSQRLASSFEVDMSNVQRIMAWTAAYKAWLAHPLTGTGAGTFFHHVHGYLDPNFYDTGQASWIDHAHNEVLELMAETGLPGAGLMLWIVAIFALTCLRVVARAQWETARYLAAALFCGGFAFLGQNLAGVSLRYTTGAVYFWMVMALASVLLLRERPETASAETTASAAGSPPSRSLQMVLGMLMVIMVFVVGQQVLNRLISDIHLETGMLAREAGAYPEAYIALDQALQLNPYSLRSYSTLAALQVDTGQFKQAVETYRALQELDAEYPKLYRGMAQAYRKMGDYAEALKAAQKDAQLEHSATTLIGLAEAYADVGQMDQAREKANEAVKLTEENRPWPHIEAAEVLLRRAQILARMDLRAEALADVRKVKALKPQSEKPYLAMGDIYRSWRQYREAIAEYEKARDLKPSEYQAYTFMGVAYAAMGDYVKAEQSYRTALFANPGDTFTRLNLGLALRQLGKTQEAQATLSGVARLGPKNPLAVQAQKALDAMGAAPTP